MRLHGGGVVAHGLQEGAANLQSVVTIRLLLLDDALSHYVFSSADQPDGRIGPARRLRRCHMRTAVAYLLPDRDTELSFAKDRTQSGSAARLRHSAQSHI